MGPTRQQAYTCVEHRGLAGCRQDGVEVGFDELRQVARHPRQVQEQLFSTFEVDRSAAVRAEQQRCAARCGVQV